MEFAVAIVEQLFGKEKADEVAGPLVRSKDSTFVIILLVF
jgi:hypothetical protein